MSKDTRTVLEARVAVIEANGKIEDILNALHEEFGVITENVNLHQNATIRRNFDVRVELEVSI